MPNRRRSTGPRAAPKLFKCTGYGNCEMVFTRSEHLARHERKHTGEKPYKCVIPGCGRMFSRFDNMMQHTQTHEKNKKMAASRSTPNLSGSRADSNHAGRGGTSVKSEHRPIGRGQPMPDFINKTPGHPLEHTSMIDSRTLPLPTRRASMSSDPYHPAAYPPPSSASESRLMHQTPFNHHPLYAGDMPRNRSSWPMKREAYPHSFYHQQSYQPYPSFQDYTTLRRRSSTSTISTESTLVSPTSAGFPPQAQIIRRRISIDELRLPIEDLRNIQLDEKQFRHCSNNNPRIHDKPSVDISPDEYEALEGFSKFRKTSIVGPNNPELTPSPVIRNESPNLASQVCAMRQRVMSTNESFQRG